MLSKPIVEYGRDMPRIARIAPGGFIFHVLNRGNARCQIFERDRDYEALERVMTETGRSDQYANPGLLHNAELLAHGFVARARCGSRPIRTAYDDYPRSTLASLSTNRRNRASLSGDVQVLSSSARRSLFNCLSICGAEFIAGRTSIEGRGLALVKSRVRANG